MQRIKSIFQSLTGYASGPTAKMSTYKGKVPIHSLTQQPTKAWDKIKVKQTCDKVQPLDPNTPIKDDCLRFVCLSDTHSAVEASPQFIVPQGDVLLHAGDFTQVGHPSKIKEFDSYLGKQSHKVKVVIAGNHDMTLDDEFVKNRRNDLLGRFGISKANFEDVLADNNVPSSRELLKNCIYLLDSSINICGLNIYGSPWQPEFGDWGFNLPRGEACLEKWDKIPDDTDILMTHGPPIGHGDNCFSGQRAGCVELLTTVQSRVKPKFHIFGHIHEAYGMTTDGFTTYINASNCTLRYKPNNPAIVFDVPLPPGHTKEELDNIPINNLSK